MTEKIDFSQTQKGELEGFFNRIADALRKSWSRETSCYLDWSEENPSAGQCEPTSLIIQDICGGKIVVSYDVGHYWNQLPNGDEIDFTNGQFKEGRLKIKTQGEASRDAMLNSDHPDNKIYYQGVERRYLLLKQEFQKHYQH